MHGLRYTHASVLLYKGANIHSVSKRLGHADIQTTLNHYSHVLKEMEQRDELIAVNVYVQ
ncbi:MULTISPECIES: tyrosine-type recombinase/integrase [Metasolibacillus]|uniref:tyrosine-type recombinase/integrase n=1 Tax=Metasolibacillus TaxID=2703677 RepID=UPI0019144FF6|nr:tyrosine-type recombinase/integrase [Metasolibacillus fluoroglycofenilyticus]